MAFNRVQMMGGKNTTFASSVTLDSTITTTAGNLLIAVVEADVVTANGVTVTDNKGNTWSRAISTALAATFDLEVWYTVITTGGSGHQITATDNGGGVDSILIVEEWSGNKSIPYDVSAGATGVVSTALNSGASASTAQAKELVIGAGVASGAVTLTPGSGYSNLNQASTDFSTLAFESKLVSSIGTQSATMTSSLSGSWVCQVVTFKESGGTIVAIPTLALLGVG